MKLKLFILKVFMLGIFCPIVGTFINLFTSGHKVLGFLFLLAVAAAYVAIEETYKALKRKFRT